MIEEATYTVRLSLTQHIDFSPIERDTPLSNADAIANAFGTMPDEVWEQLRDEGWTVDVSNVWREES